MSLLGSAAARRSENPWDILLFYGVCEEELMGGVCNRHGAVEAEKEHKIRTFIPKSSRACFAHEPRHTVLVRKNVLKVVWVGSR